MIPARRSRFTGTILIASAAFSAIAPGEDFERTVLRGTERMSGRMSIHDQTIVFSAFNPSAGEANDAEIWDLGTRKRLKTYPVPGEAIASQGQWVCSVVDGGEVDKRELFVWDSTTGERRWTVKHPRDFKTRAAFAPGKLFTATESLEKQESVEVRDLETGKVTARWELPKNNVGCSALRYIASKDQLLALNGEMGRIFDVATGRVVRDIDFGSFPGEMTIAVSSDGALVVYDAEEGLEVRVINLQTGKLIHKELPVYSPHFMAMAFRPNTHVLAIGASTKSDDEEYLMLIDCDTGTILQTLDDSAQGQLVWSEDGVTLFRSFGRGCLIYESQAGPTGPTR